MFRNGNQVNNEAVWRNPQMGPLWSFLANRTNQKPISWLSEDFIVIASVSVGLLAPISHTFAQNCDLKAEGGSIGICGDVRDSKIIVGVPEEKLDELVRERTKPLEDLTVSQKDTISLLKEKLDLNERQVRDALDIVGEKYTPPLGEALVRVAGDYRRLQAQVSALNPDNPSARALVDEAKHELNEGRSDRALDLLHRATEAQLTAAEEADKLEAQAHAAREAQLLGAASSTDAEAQTYRLLHRYDDAEKLYLRAIEIEQKVSGSRQLLAVSLNNLGELYLGSGRFKNAKASLKDSIEIQESFGDENINLIVPLSNLGQVYWATFQYPDAEVVYKRAIVIGEKALPANDSRLVKTRLNYAQLLDRLGRVEEAAKLRLLATSATQQIDKPK
jgi:tetratricopeptide (TPR) repeat protein